MSELLRKALSIKDVTEAGIVVAAFATLNVIDKDGDVTLPGFFGQQETVMLPAHDWKSVPIGKGTIREVGDKAIAELKMNLSIQKAKDWHSALIFDLKEGKPLQEWSYGFTILPGGSSPGAVEERQVRLLRPAPEGGPGGRVHEVSPVLVGAGQDTATLSAKQDGMTFGKEAEAALAAVRSLVERGKALAALREKEGRGLSASAREGLDKVRVEIVKLAGEIGEMFGPDVQAEALREAARFEAGRNQIRSGGR